LNIYIFVSHCKNVKTSFVFHVYAFGHPEMIFCGDFMGNNVQSEGKTSQLDLSTTSFQLVVACIITARLIQLEIIRIVKGKA